MERREESEGGTERLDRRSSALPRLVAILTDERVMRESWDSSGARRWRSLRSHQGKVMPMRCALGNLGILTRLTWCLGVSRCAAGVRVNPF